MGKGDRRRPLAIDDAQMTSNWEEVFGRAPELVCDECHAVDSEDNPIVVMGVGSVAQWICMACMDQMGYFNEEPWSEG